MLSNELASGTSSSDNGKHYIVSDTWNWGWRDGKGDRAEKQGGLAA